MNFLTVKPTTQWIISVCLLTILCTASKSHAVKPELLIGGLYYKKINYMKDIISDILPPPAYIIESYLTVLEITDEMDKGAQADKARIDKLLAYGKQLADADSTKDPFPGYHERIRAWVKDLTDKTPEEKKIKELMTKTTVTPAKKFFSERDSKFASAVKAGKRDEALKIARTELKSAYDQHRKLIVELVKAATSTYTAIEALAQEKAKAGDTKDIILRGPLYIKAIQMKDLIADILPPPKYIIESYLTVLQAADALEAGKKEEAVKLLEYGKLLRNSGSGITGYNERHEYWVKNLEEKTLPIRL